MARLSERQIGLVFATLRVIQWLSTAIVMGISSYFIAVGPRNQHALYWEVLSVVSVVIFFLASALSYLLFRDMGRFTWAYYVIFTIDFTFSYLWLTTFIFAAQDYNLNNCKLGSPLGVSCGVKKANESFMFITFISSICLALFLGSPLSPFSTYSFDESQTQDANNFPAISENEAR
ncbi:predicted protein [Aspergillus terreus NIH2624]|uniref:MARVEL domain-containing protein n=1 Tax=Aspergillus terreus (strain NIH 2624 / FGSC A1156) TaxID=341663 RepID=Q0C7T2_ASPTN|nr:uncharacterized protein ATEG_10252 [Aspergillus terreus NIH2624]EAU29249.1 predicted protein [Aspergillus terreus NIH2624]